jgi:hypothetical protein
MGEGEKMSLQEAKDPQTSAQRLRALSASRDKNIQRALSRNPNTPPDLLLALARWYPREVIQNRCVPALLLEDPSFFCRVDEVTALSLLSVAAPVWLLVSLSKHTAPTIRGRVGRDPNTPSEILELLAQDDATIEEHRDREDACESGRDEATYTVTATVQSCVAENPSTPTATLRMLVTVGLYDRCVRDALTRNSSVTPEMLQR